MTLAQPVEGLEISAQQRHLWLLQQGEEAPFPYRVECAVELPPGLDDGDLRRALDALVARHEVLRTGVRRLPGLRWPLQVIGDGGVDWRRLETDGDDPDALVRRLLGDERRLDVDGGRPLRATRAADVLLVELPALCADLETLDLLLEELAARLGGAPEDDEPALHYADYAQWQADLLDGPEAEHWRRLGADGIPTLQLPLARSPRGVFRPRRHHLELPAGTEAAAGELASAVGSVSRVVLLAAWAALLHRVSGQRDLVVGVRHDGRAYEELAALIGPLATYLPTRLDVAPSHSFHGFVEQVSGAVTTALEHGEYFAHELLGEEEEPLVLSAAFEDGAAPAAVTGAGVTLVPRHRRALTDRFAVRLAVGESGADLWCDGSVVDADTAAALGRRYARLLAAALEAPQTTLGDLGILVEGERRQVVVEWNETGADYGGPRLLHEMVAEQAERTPEAVAVSSGDLHLSYRDLRRRSRDLARRLAAHGVGSDDLVAVCLERSADLVVALLGSLEAGAGYLPLDPDYPAERLDYMLRDAGAAALLTDRRSSARVPAGGSGTVVPVLYVDDGPSAGDGVEPSPAHPDGTAYVLYTSGSTGRPKGVVIPHRSIVNHMQWMRRRFPLAGGEAVLQKTPFSFDASVWEFYAPLIDGGRLVMARPGGHKEPGYLLRETAAREVETLQVVPSLLRLLLEEPSVSRSGLRRVYCGGEALPPELRDAFYRRLPAADLINVYGPTEATIHTAFEVVPEDGPVAIGTPIGNGRVYVLDRRLEPQPVGVAGELHAGGANVGRGYLGRPALTAASYLPDPFSDRSGARMYRSGDLARWWPDGRLEFLGRVDHQVKFRGYRVELGEIESVLERNPGVRQAVVVARRDGGTERLVAYLVAASGAGVPPEAELRNAAAEALPDFMVPTSFVILDELPLTPSGKVDRKALPAPGATVVGAEYVAPRNPAEERLAAVWGEVLGLDRVGVETDFFELGGDSILSIQIVGRATREGLRMTPKMLFEHRTVAALAAVLGEGEAEPAAEAGPVSGPVPLTPIQRAFLEPRPVAPHHFNQALLLAVGDGTHRTPLDGGALRRAAGELVRHHDALRARFLTAPDGTVEQVIAPVEEVEPAVTEIDLEGVPAARRPALVTRLCAAVQTGLDLEAGPLFRVVRLHWSDGERLLLLAHHLVVDGVSWRILLEDLEAAWSGRALPPRTASWRAWGEHLVERAAAPETAVELEHWLAPERRRVASLPLADAGADNLESLAEVVRVGLDREETESLLRRVPKAYRTRIDEVLLTALVQAVGAWTGSGRLLVDVEGHGRAAEELDLTRTVGWFTNQYPLLLDVEGATGPGEALVAVKEQVRAVPGEGLGWGLLCWLGEPEVRRRLAAMPAPEVSFNYLGQLDAALATSDLLRPAPESAGPDRDGGQRRQHLLDVGGGVADGCLELAFRYAGAVLDGTAVEELAAAYVTALRRLIDHCLGPDAGGVTPSDFPLADLDSETLERLVASSSSAVEDVYPLSPLQEGLLFHALHSPAAGLYFQQLAVLLEGELETEPFRRAWEWATARHGVLRTRFAWEGMETPLQVVEERVELPVTVEDWRGAGDGLEERWEALLAADRRRGFVLGEAPLQRLTVIRVGEREHRVVWSHHHLILDGWSVPILVGEVFEAYAALRRGDEPSAPRPPRFRDYLAWLRRQDRGAAEEFWRRELAGFEEPTPLVDDRPAADGVAEDGGDGVSYLQELLPRDVSEGLRALARARHLTLFTLLQGAWGLLLSRYGGGDDVVFGTTTAGRPPELPGAERMLGVFINTLPSRLRVAADAGLVPWLEAVQSANVAARQYEHTPLARIQGWSDVPAGRPLFESLFVFENYPVEETVESGEHGLAVTGARLESRTNYPLTLVVADGAAVPLRLVYAPGRFTAPTVRRMLRHLGNLLAAMVRRPEARLAELSVLDAAERHQVLHGWNPRGGVAVEHPTVVHAFAARAAERPDAVALVAGEMQITYGEMDRRTSGVATRLAAAGVGPGDRVGLLSRRSPELVVGLVGILRAGASYVPLDPDYPAQRLRFMLRDAAVSLVLVDRGSADLLPTGEVPSEPLLAAAVGDPVPPRALPEGEAYLIYTSGSTGRPKGVSVPHAAVARLIPAVRDLGFEAGGDDVWSLFHSYAFDFSVWEIWGALALGGRLLVVPYRVSRSPEDFATLVDRQRVTVLNATPSAFRAFLTAGDGGGVPGRGALRWVVFGGERLEPPALAPWFAANGEERPRLVNMYGITETTVHATYREMTAADARDAAASPIGRPLADLPLYLLDRRGTEPAPVGVAGEIWVGGAGVTTGYAGRPALTAERFRPDPFTPGSSSDPEGRRLYRSGDLARRLPDGELHFLGRADQQVKVRGFRIEPGEIEAVLEGHPAVQRAVVLAVDDDGGGRLAAWLSPAGDGRPDDTELRDWMARRLPAHMVVAALTWLDGAPPLTPSGKVDRRALLARPPEVTADAAQVALGPTEEVLAGIWQRVLGVAPTTSDADFYALGGHSLSATQVVSRIRDTFDVELPLADLFEVPRLGDLAARVDALAAGGRSLPPLVPAPRDEPLPLSYAQQRLWVLDRMSDVGVPYHVPAAVRLTGDLHPEPLRRALERAVERHEALRTRFAEVAGRPVQVVEPPPILPLPVLDLAALPADLRDREARRLASEEGERPFRLDRAPLLRARLLRLAPREHAVLLTVHHIVADAWSLGVLVRDVAELYAATLEGRRPELPELVVRYGDFARWQRRWLRGAELDGLTGYWRRRLAGAPPVVELPLDRPRPEEPGHAGAVRALVLPEELVGELRVLARDQGVTLFMLLLAAFQALLHSYSSSEDVVVGSNIAARNRAEVEDLVGFFVNMLVLRTDLSGNPTFRGLLRRVRRVTLGAYAHQELPFDKLVDELKVERDPRVHPLFQAVFTLQNTPLPEISLPALELRPQEVEVATTHFDLIFNLMDTGDAVRGVVQYARELFDDDTVAAMAERFVALLRVVAVRPEARLKEVCELAVEAGVEEWLEREKDFNQVVDETFRTVRRKPVKLT